MDLRNVGILHHYMAFSSKFSFLLSVLNTEDAVLPVPLHGKQITVEDI
jgi:hypothetical protein